MTIKVEHEMHKRKLSNNLILGLILVGFVGLIFGLTVVKVTQLGEAQQFERFDHVQRPAIIPDAEESAN